MEVSYDGFVQRYFKVLSDFSRRKKWLLNSPRQFIFKDFIRRRRLFLKYPKSELNYNLRNLDLNNLKLKQTLLDYYSPSKRILPWYLRKNFERNLKYSLLGKFQLNITNYKLYYLFFLFSLLFHRSIYTKRLQPKLFSNFFLKKRYNIMRKFPIYKKFLRKNFIKNIKKFKNNNIYFSFKSYKLKFIKLINKLNSNLDKFYIVCMKYNLKDLIIIDDIKKKINKFLSTILLIDLNK